MIRYESGLGRRFTQGQFDALVSFTFNLGSGWMYDDCRLTRWLENPSTDLQLVWAMGVWCRGRGGEHPPVQAPHPGVEHFPVR